jgi:DNA polymerase-3 subunit delta'
MELQMSLTGLLPQPPYPWFTSVWEGFARQVDQDRLPHAVLLVGQTGIGILELARAMGQYLLCSAPRPERSCGQCRACLLIQADSHPDLHWVAPEEGAQSIKIAQIREMTEFTNKTAQQGGRKLVVLSPAEAMNANAANALLKSLEEPNGDCVYLLVSEQPAFLMATIRSRCSRLQIRTPEFADALQWLERNRVADAENLLQAAGGRPLRVMEWLSNDLWGQREQLRGELLKLLDGTTSFLECAKVVSAFGGVWIVEQLQIWMAEAVRTSASRQRCDDALIGHLMVLPMQRLLRFYDFLGTKKRLLLSTANPNPQLLLEEIMMDLKELGRKTS